MPTVSFLISHKFINLYIFQHRKGAIKSNLLFRIKSGEQAIAATAHLVKSQQTKCCQFQKFWNGGETLNDEEDRLRKLKGLVTANSTKICQFA